ncbi:MULTISPECIES: hypothetical protein [Asticcacaulis]|uniref:hypothetical protein n=1 Tax=Asticcacaulis TaxID=76890 RepID=UPI001AE2C28D|nr:MULTISPECIES: hypothetical protein [Asticcacaulis]MBP2160500.1 hypothetical protein [Asticcacaulis solisilvae]MDR6801545.1 hypothetical protein [Asticcacaulis sp. BE141]
MTIESFVIQRFYELAKEAERIDSEAFDQPVEPAFDSVLEFVLEHPESRAAFAAAFLEIAKNPDKGPPDLIQYCMHVLRWEEVRRFIVSWLQTEPSERVRHVLRKYVRSFDDEWDGAVFYDRFS